MIIACQSCASRFRVDDAKVPAGSFQVTCPKCKTTFTSRPVSQPEPAALGLGKTPATADCRVEHPTPAPLFKTAIAAPVTAAAASPLNSVNDLAAALNRLLRPEQSHIALRPAWDRRRVLVCTGEKYRELVAGQLNDGGCEVFVAADIQQAVERMRESRLDVVILDQDFDPADQGVAFVTREVNVRRPADRRRLFFVLLSSSKRTLDAHTAFLQNVNLIINLNDLPELATILERSLREYNDLYRDFFISLNLNPL